MRQMRAGILLFAILSVFHFIPVFADYSTQDRIDHLVNSLLKNIAPQTPEKKVMAILPPSTSVALARQQVDFAFSEMLTHYIVQSGKFRVVERTQIVKILEEQKLQQSGAVDTSEAVKIGKILGAELILLGSVEKFNKRYNMNARVVDVQSGEILSTAIEEFPQASFEEEAKPYLRLVPETQAIGLYAAYCYHMKSESVPTPAPVTRTSTSGTFTTTTNFSHSPERSIQSYYGGGLRYYPIRHIMLDFQGLVQNDRAGIIGKSFMSEHTTDSSIPADYVYSGQEDSTFDTATILKFYFGYTSASEHFNWTGGIGISHYNALATSYLGSIKVAETPLFARIGAEFRPQQRVGLGLYADYLLQTVEGKISDGGPVVFKYNPFSVTPTLSIYF